jgi:hypothetical protein
MCNIALPAAPPDSQLFVVRVFDAAVGVSLLLCALMCTHLMLAITHYQISTID